jgi:hypothetical protein
MFAESAGCTHGQHTFSPREKGGVRGWRSLAVYAHDDGLRERKGEREKALAVARRWHAW